MIQIITDSPKKNMDKEFNNEKYTFSTIERPRSLDEFEINVIDLSGKSLWAYKGSSVVDRINSTKEISDLRQMIINSQRTKILIVLPTNILFKFQYKRVGIHGSSDYAQAIPLKHNLVCVYNVVENLIGSPVNLLYEPTTTTIGETKLFSDFYFADYTEGITLSDKSQKVTTIPLGENIVLTTLNRLDGHAEFISFLSSLKWIKDKENTPVWFDEIECFDDRLQKEEIEKRERVIEEAQEEIEKHEAVLLKNGRWKSILYQTGEELTKIVFEILEDIFKVNLSNFLDELNEDFRFEVEDTTFIGEIKGVSTGVKSEHVSQLDRHYQNYIENRTEEDQVRTKPLLIINHQRNQAPSKREKIHHRQEQLSRRNESLIIETTSLLKIYEKYKNKEITEKDVLVMFKDNTGVLEI